MKMRKWKWIILAGIIIVVLGVVLLKGLSNAREDARRESCLSNLHGIGFAIMMYAQEYKGYFPFYDNAKGMEMLRSGGYLENIYMFPCPSVDRPPIADGSQITEEVTDYCYKGGLSEKSPVQLLMWDKPGNHMDFGNVLYSDGAVKGFDGKDWLEKAQKETKK